MIRELQVSFSLGRIFDTVPLLTINTTQLLSTWHVTKTKVNSEQESGWLQEAKKGFCAYKSGETIHEELP